jgi:hypothetical protein
MAVALKIGSDQTVHEGILAAPDGALYALAADGDYDPTRPLLFLGDWTNGDALMAAVSLEPVADAYLAAEVCQADRLHEDGFASLQLGYPKCYFDLDSAGEYALMYDKRRMAWFEPQCDGWRTLHHRLPGNGIVFAPWLITSELYQLQAVTPFAAVKAGPRSRISPLANQL